MNHANEVIYCGDTRYPGPASYPVPEGIEGVPTQAELDAHPRLFTWGELKEIIHTSNLGRLSRNKELQARYEVWMTAQREKYGSTEAYLTQVRLPWRSTPSAPHPAPEPTYDAHTALAHGVDLTPSTNPDAPPKSKRTAGFATHGRHPSGSAAVAQHILAGETPGYSHKATLSTPGTASGASTPSSVAYVNIDDALERVSKRLRRKAGSSASDDEHHHHIPNSHTNPNSGPNSNPNGEAPTESQDEDIYLRYDPQAGLDSSKYAVLPNDWPYCIPYGVRHFCVWSRVPIAHPKLIGFDRDAWANIEENGLAGFTGVIPNFDDNEPGAGTAKGEPKLNGGPGRSGPKSPQAKGGWYAVDVAYSGSDVQKWAGVRYESPGGSNVGDMVRGLWDERGWETIWFVNPARLQSVPGFSHFHVFARRKTPEEINVSEKVFAPKDAQGKVRKEGEGRGGAGEDTPALNNAEQGNAR